MLLKIEDIYTWGETGSSHRNVIEGNRVFKANHIVKIGKNTENACADQTSLTAWCLQTSHLKDPPHEINGLLSKNGKILSMVCSCRAGLGEKCKHIFATLIFCSVYDVEDFSPLPCTDKKCEWKKVLTEKQISQYPVPLEEHPCFAKPQKKYQLDPSTDDQDSADLLEIIYQTLPESALTKRKIGRHSPVLFRGDSQFKEVSDSDQKAMEAIFSQDNLIMQRIREINVGQLSACCEETIKSLTCNCVEVCVETRKSYSNWHKERRFRITGTSCYQLFTYSKNKRPDWKKKCSSHLNAKSFKTEYTEYGKLMEGRARDVFVNMTNFSVIQTGLVVSKDNPWLACSPDGVVYQDGKPSMLLEIKCPMEGKTKVVEQVVEAQIKKTLTKDNQQNYAMKTKHPYYGQVQLGMALLNVKQAAFVIYSDFDKKIFILMVPFDSVFVMEMLSTLKIVYYKIMAHEICLMNAKSDENNASNKN